MKIPDDATTFSFDALRAELNVVYKEDRKLGDDMACVLCGKRCRDPKYFVELIDGGLDTAATEEEAAKEEHHGGHMGSMPLGPACARKVKKAIGEAAYKRFVFVSE